MFYHKQQHKKLIVIIIDHHHKLHVHAKKNNGVTVYSGI